MPPKICSITISAKARAHTRRAASIVLVSATVWIVSAARARADDDAALRRIEVQIQRLEERHQSEIKELQAEIRRLRKQKTATVATA